MAPALKFFIRILFSPRRARRAVTDSKRTRRNGVALNLDSNSVFSCFIMSQPRQRHKADTLVAVLFKKGNLACARPPRGQPYYQLRQSMHIIPTNDPV